MNDFRNPLVVRKHFDNKQQAERYIKKYGNKWHQIVSWEVAINMNLSDGPKNLRNKLARYSKYEFPSGINTQIQKQYFRYTYRRKLRRKKRRPTVKYKDLKIILDEKEMLFFKRLNAYGGYYQAYTFKVKGFDDFKEMYDYPYDMVNLSAIYLCLQKHYDCGPFNQAETAILIYELFKEKVIKWRCGPDMSFKEEEDIKKEFLARGFVDKKVTDFGEDDAWVETIYIKPTLVYPEECWFHHVDKGVYDHSVFELQELVGISGYTRARQPL